MARLADLRWEKRLSQRDVANKTGLAMSTISQAEAGKGHPIADTVRRICEALGVRPDEVDEFKGVGG